MGRKKTDAVERAVGMVISGECKTAYEAARKCGVAQSSVSRDARYKAWKLASEAARAAGPNED